MSFTQEEIAAMPDEQIGEPDAMAFMLCVVCHAPRASMLRKITRPDGTLSLEHDLVCTVDPTHEQWPNLTHVR